MRPRAPDVCSTDPKEQTRSLPSVPAARNPRCTPLAREPKFIHVLSVLCLQVTGSRSGTGVAAVNAQASARASSFPCPPARAATAATATAATPSGLGAVRNLDRGEHVDEGAKTKEIARVRLGGEAVGAGRGRRVAVGHDNLARVGKIDHTDVDAAHGVGVGGAVVHEQQRRAEEAVVGARRHDAMQLDETAAQLRDEAGLHTNAVAQKRRQRRPERRRRQPPSIVLVLVDVATHVRSVDLHARAHTMHAEPKHG